MIKSSRQSSDTSHWRTIKDVGQCLTNGLITTEYALQRAILLLTCYLSFFSFIFPSTFFSLSRGIFHRLFAPAKTVFIFHVRSSKSLFSFCLPVLATCACVYLQNLLATTQTWRRCPLFWLPCDVVLTVFRNKLEWQDAARCAASFSRPPLF